MRSTRVMTGAVFAGLMALAPVGRGGGDAAATTQPPETTPAATAATASTEAEAGWPPPQESLDAAVLTIADMPAGWATVVDDEDNSQPCDAGLAQVLGRDEDLPQGEFIAAEDADLGPLLANFVTVLPPGAPATVMTEWRDRMLACEGEFEGLDVSYRELSLSLPPLGDETIALRLDLAADQASSHIDMLIIRTGDVVVALQAYDQFGDAAALLVEYGPVALDRATSALD